MEKERTDILQSDGRQRTADDPVTEPKTSDRDAV